jgi:hypothetical protein
MSNSQGAPTPKLATTRYCDCKVICDYCEDVKIQKKRDASLQQWLNHCARMLERNK